MKAIAVKNTFNAKSSLKSNDFTYDSKTKTWAKEFSSKEDFENWYSKEFANVTYSGCKQARFNSAVVFEFVENESEVSDPVKATSNTPETTIIPSEEEAVRMVKAGEIKDFHFHLGRYKAVLDGFIMHLEEGGNIIDIRTAGNASAEHEENLTMIINKAAESYITRLHNNK